MHLRRSGAIVTGLFVFAVGGLAAAGITPSGDTNGTVTAGQVLTFSIADSFAGSAPGGPPYGWCDASAYNVSAGQASGSPYGSTASLAISCADAGQGSLTGAWTYTGSVVATVPQDAAATITETVSVHEAVPLQLASDSGCTCVYNNNYSQTYTYPLVSGQTASTSPTTATDTSGGATTAATTSTSATTSTASTVTTAATTTTNTRPPPKTPTLHGPSVVYVMHGQRKVRVKFASSDQQSLQRLCWWHADAPVESCVRGHGLWFVTLAATPGQRLFSLWKNGRVVSRLALVVKVKR